MVYRYVYMAIILNYFGKSNTLKSNKDGIGPPFSKKSGVAVENTKTAGRFFKKRPASVVKKPPPRFFFWWGGLKIHTKAVVCGGKKKKKVTEVVKNNLKNEKAPGGGVFFNPNFKKAVVRRTVYRFRILK